MNFCASCGTKLELSWIVCPGCGNPAGAQAVNTAGNQPGTLENPQVIRTQRENIDRVERDKLTSRANVLSMASMWLSLAGLILLLFAGAGIVLSIAGVICGRISQKNMRDAHGSESSYAKVGVIVGYVGIILAVVVTVITLIGVSIGLSMLNSIESPF